MSHRIRGTLRLSFNPSPLRIKHRDDGGQAFSAGASGHGPQIFTQILPAFRPDQPQQLSLPGPLEAVAGEVEAAVRLRHVHDTGFVRMQRELCSFHPPLHKFERLPCRVRGRCQNDDVIRIPHASDAAGDR